MNREVDSPEQFELERQNQKFLEAWDRRDRLIDLGLYTIAGVGATFVFFLIVRFFV